MNGGGRLRFGGHHLPMPSVRKLHWQGSSPRQSSSNRRGEDSASVGGVAPQPAVRGGQQPHHGQHRWYGQAIYTNSERIQSKLQKFFIAERIWPVPIILLDNKDWLVRRKDRTYGPPSTSSKATGGSATSATSIARRRRRSGRRTPSGSSKCRNHWRTSPDASDPGRTAEARGEIPPGDRNLRPIAVAH